ncbi:MAG: hypothetical protein NVSMB52_13870 [Chloroflexota bacterium]
MLGVSGAGISSLLGSQWGVAEAQSVVPKYLVLIVLDAFRPEYQSLAPMPALGDLMRRGTVYDRAWVGQLESETPTGHATISTGCMPKNNGILGFEWRDPTTKQEVLDGWPAGVLAGDMERDLRASGTTSIPAAIKASDPRSSVVAVSSEKVYAADAMGGWAADYILYHQHSGPRKDLLVPSFVPGHRPPEDILQQPSLQIRLPMRHFTDWDWLSAQLALTSLLHVQPKALLINMPGADFYGHPYGGPASPAVMAQIAAGLDRNIARIVAAYKQAGIYDQTVFVVTADHGMVPNTRTVSGDVTKAAVRHVGGQYLFHTGGTAADVYLRNPWHSRAVAAEMMRVPNVAGSYYQVGHKGRYEYVPAPGMKISPSLDAAYQYLLATFSGPTAPDVVAPFRENTIGGLYKNAHGDHGGVNWGAQHIPLVLSGPGVQSGRLSHFPARLMDIAPTVLRLLGLPTAPMDGVVLGDALLSPTATDMTVQSDMAPSLTAYQDALMEQSTANIAEDKKDRVLPPPSAPLRP